MMQLGLFKKAVQAIVLVAIVFLAGWAVIWHVSETRTASTISLLLAGIICLVMAMVSLVPLAMINEERKDYLGQAILAGTGLRMFLTLMVGLGVYVLFIEPEQRNVFGLGLLVNYMVLLIWETITALTVIRTVYPKESALEVSPDTKNKVELDHE